MTDYSNCPSRRALRKELDELREYNRQLADALFGCEERFPRLPGMTGQMIEFVRCLYKRPKNEIATKEVLWMLTEHLTGSRPEIKIVDVVICKLRRVMPPDSIRTIWGRGYSLTESGRAWVLEHVKAFKKEIEDANLSNNPSERCSQSKPSWHKRSGRLAPLSD